MDVTYELTGPETRMATLLSVRTIRREQAWT